MTSDSSDASVLLIDDDRQLATMLSDFLRPDKLKLTTCDNGEDGLDLLRTEKFDLVILDVMLPGISGLDVLRKLRQDSEVPVIMLTARGDDVDRIVGLEIGADDYLPKPFNPRELSARIKAILRRAQLPSGNSAERLFSGIRLDPRTRKASVDGEAMRLTGTEFEILGCLLETPGNVVSKEALSERALGRRLLPYDRSIDTHISNLRGKLEKAGNDSVTIQNQRGIGYVLIPGT
ncbi:MAG: response regulator transcription factor [Woeseia sp.]